MVLRTRPGYCRAMPSRLLAQLLAAIAIAAAATASDEAAQGAELKINPPSMDRGEVDFEDNSSVILARGRSRDVGQAHFAELGYGVTDFWWTEVEGHWENGGGALGLAFRTVDFENAFRVVRQDALWPEAAVFIEYDHATDRQSPETATVAGLFRKDIGRSTTVLNLLFDHDLGRNASTGARLRYVGTSTWTLIPEFAPGIQFFGQPGKLGDFDSLSTQDHRLGPIVAGSFDMEGLGELGYSGGYLFGLTPTSPNGTLVWRLEYDRRF
jgi:hypothetical protein